MYCTRLLPLLVCLSLLGACVSQSKQGTAGDLRYVLDKSPFWQACAARCEQGDELGVLTRKGCLRGCELAQAAFPPVKQSYGELAMCFEDVERVRLDTVLDRLKAQCKASWKHLYKRRGCTDAVQAYYSQWSTSRCVVEKVTESSAAPAVAE